LFPRNVLPTIFFVLMSMNAISFESRLTIMTTDVGSVILTAGAWAPTTEPVAAAPAAAMSPAMMMRRLALTMRCAPDWT
jgi:hypothetical protein